MTGIHAAHAINHLDAMWFHAREVDGYTEGGISQVPELLAVAESALSAAKAIIADYVANPTHTMNGYSIMRIRQHVPGEFVLLGARKSRTAGYEYVVAYTKDPNGETWDCGFYTTDMRSAFEAHEKA